MQFNISVVDAMSNKHLLCCCFVVVVVVAVSWIFSVLC